MQKKINILKIVLPLVCHRYVIRNKVNWSIFYIKEIIKKYYYLNDNQKEKEKKREVLKHRMLHEKICIKSIFQY